MFDFIGWTELLVIAVVAIIVMGPRELTEFMRTVGKTMGTLKRTADDFRRQFDDALKDTELSQLKSEFEETAAEIKNPLTEFEKSVQGDLDDIERTYREKSAAGSGDGNSKTETKPPSVAERAQKAAEAHADQTPELELSGDDTGTDNVTPLRKQA